MARMRPKMIAVIDNARLSWAEICAVFAHEYVTEDKAIEWGGATEKEIAAITSAIIDPLDWCLSYPGGKETLYSFNTRASKHARPLYAYSLRAVPGEDGESVEVTLDRGRDTIARVSLDLDYFEALGTLSFDGEDEDWDRVED